MYWLLDEQQQQRIRELVTRVVTELSTIEGNPHVDQLFPYVGRKDRRKAKALIRHLSLPGDVVCDPFSGSGIIPYATQELERKLFANEWEPFANRLSSAPWRLPSTTELSAAYQALLQEITEPLNKLYQITCSCGNKHVLHTQFFDRLPLRYRDVALHERLGTQGQTITYRTNKYRCPNCLATEKFFDEQDEAHLSGLESFPTDPIFEFKLIENSRINLSKEFTVYGKLFPQRAKLALVIIWKAITKLDCSAGVRLFLEDVFLSILPQAKYKDYRSKSQDLHCPTEKLREVNLLYVYQERYQGRLEGLLQYRLHTSPHGELSSSPIEMQDFRDFLKSKTNGSVSLVLTDPPWTDGTAYFERAQLYHPWLKYDLKVDANRLAKEMVVTDAPSRRDVHDIERWWSDLEELFAESYRVLGEEKFLALFFRPIPASRWLTNLNRMKLVARRAGFEPLLSINVGDSDPSMRIQQSASYVFSKDVVMLFLRLAPNLGRVFFEEYDLDQLVYQAAVELQEEKHSPFFYRDWRAHFSRKLRQLGLERLDSPREEPQMLTLFKRYCDEVSSGLYLPKMLTPFSDQLFDTPAIERFFVHVPQIIAGLTQGDRRFTYDQFLLALAEFVENGTRQLINDIEKVDMRKLIETYAEPIESGQWFRRRPLPQLPTGIKNILELDPYAFEGFVAKLFEAQGFTSVAIIGRAGDRGVDVTGIDPSGVKTVIQCKRYISNNVDATPVQRLHSFAMTRGAGRKILVSTSGFTPHAVEEASHTKTELVDRGRLEKLVTKYLPDFFEETR